MVLSRNGGSRLLSASLLGLLVGCIHAAPQAKLDKEAPVAVAYYVDKADQPAAMEMPPEVQQALASELGARNLVVKSAPAGSRVRTSAQRLSTLARSANGAPFVMLVETKVLFFDFMEGRFKWTVYAKVTMARPDALGDAIVREFDVPVFLRFDYQKEREALLDASSSIADHAGKLADEFLGAQSVPSVPGAESKTTSLRERPRAIYFVMVDRFADGDKSNDQDVDLKDPAAFHGGDLQGVLDHLDDIQKLGFDTVWLSPVFAMRHEKFFGHGAFHGYWVEDFTHIDRRFGDRRLLRRLSDELHRRHMKLLLDVVLNHVAFDSPLLKQHPEWFHHNGEIKDWNDPKQLQTYDVMGLPDLAQEREDVYQYLLKTSEMWIDVVRPDGFRLDAVKHISPAFWKRYNGEIHQYAGKDFFLLGEDLDGDPAHLAKTATDDGFDAMFDFPLYFAMKDVFCDDKPLGRLAAILSLDRTYPGDDSLVTLVDNHDLPRIATACHGDAKRIHAALAFTLRARGIPSVTYGTGIGLTGEHEPENRADMRWDAPATVDLASLLKERQPPHGATRILKFTPDGFVVAFGETALAVDRSGAHAIAATSSDATSTRQVQLAVHGAPGGSLSAVGAGPELGAWNPDHGAPATSSEVDVTLPTASVFELKLVVRHPDGKLEWESRDDRFLFVPPGDGPLRVEATWNGS